MGCYVRSVSLRNDQTGEGIGSWFFSRTLYHPRVVLKYLICLLPRKGCTMTRQYIDTDDTPTSNTLDENVPI